MTAVQMNTLNSQIWRDMGIISENEGMMIRVAKYLRKVVKEMTADPSLMTKEQFYARLDEAKKGKTYQMLPGEDLTAYLKRQGYDI